jgi:hypothetical protein
MTPWQSAGFAQIARSLLCRPAQAETVSAQHVQERCYLQGFLPSILMLSTNRPTARVRTFFFVAVRGRDALTPDVPPRARPTEIVLPAGADRLAGGQSGHRRGGRGRRRTRQATNV